MGKIIKLDIPGAAGNRSGTAAAQADGADIMGGLLARTRKSAEDAAAIASRFERYRAACRRDIAGALAIYAKEAKFHMAHAAIQEQEYRYDGHDYRIKCAETSAEAAERCVENMLDLCEGAGIADILGGSEERSGRAAE